MFFFSHGFWKNCFEGFLLWGWARGWGRIFTFLFFPPFFSSRRCHADEEVSMFSSRGELGDIGGSFFFFFLATFVSLLMPTGVSGKT